METISRLQEEYEQVIWDLIDIQDRIDNYKPDDETEEVEEAYHTMLDETMTPSYPGWTGAILQISDYTSYCIGLSEFINEMSPEQYEQFTAYTDLNKELECLEEDKTRLYDLIGVDMAEAIEAHVECLNKRNPANYRVYIKEMY